MNISGGSRSAASTYCHIVLPEILVNIGVFKGWRPYTTKQENDDVAELNWKNIEILEEVGRSSFTLSYALKLTFWIRLL